LGSRVDGARASIIRFWRTVELFSPPGVEKVSRERRVFAASAGGPLPWERGHELAAKRLESHLVWRHLVYLGVYPLESVFETLLRVFAPDEESFDERPPGESALAAFVVTHDGRPLIGSEVLSSCAWATGRSVAPGPGSPRWLSGFDGVSEAFSAAFADLVAADEDDQYAVRLRRKGHVVGRPLDWALLADCHGLAAKLTQADKTLPHAEIRISSRIGAKRRAYSTDGAEFLNSFIAEDLAMVADKVGEGTIGPALREYLRPEAEIDTNRRIDVRERLDAVLDATAPSRVPVGRWPSDPAHPLALSQQLAVSSAVALTGSGLFAVNGPPGTGKTTMLRDLIAAVVVERARRLADLAQPRDAFVGRQVGWKTGEYTRTVYTWKPELTGFEIVLASANNGAVENVTNEIPARDAIDECWIGLARELDYFPHIATALLAVDREDDEEPGRAAPAGDGGWALMAARLGNKENRSKFVGAFWYSKPDDEKLPAPTPPFSELPEELRAKFGLLGILKLFEAHPPPGSWADAVAEFRAALGSSTAVQADRGRTYDALTRRTRAEDQANAARRAFADAEQLLAALRAQLSEAERAFAGWQTTREERHRRRVEHRQFQPGLVEWLLTWGRAMREWRERDGVLAGEIVTAEQEAAAAREQVARVVRDIRQADTRARHAKDALGRAERECEVIRALLAKASTQLGQRFPDADWWRDRPRRELGALWTDETWNRARTRLFIAALRLHKAFLRHVPTEMRQSLHAAADIVAGEAPRDLPESAVLEAWRALFFVVPVVSTTFASFARLFTHLGKEALGWLLIDEAGQATPQSAVGALWRAKRAVIVGDPLQLEPITTLPFPAEQAIRGNRRVDEQWLTSRTSVQRLADRLTPLGTSLPAEEGKIWVGAPLAVHRRCDQPMFGIANDIAYDGLMINGTAPAQAEAFTAAYPSLPGSKWIDITDTHADGHWIPAEGHEAERILSALAKLGFDMSKVMVIGPFRDIARRISRYKNTYKGLVAGTVHTSQGKQADIVILVLGGNPQRPGARRWAARKPNLLNVAVSRAKRRLYVIGNHQAWANQRHFSTLAHRLPHEPPR
jgi:hypothetical protein